MGQLTAAAQDGRTLQQALDRIPASERSATLRILREAGLSPTTEEVTRAAVRGGGVNALAGEE